MTLKFRFRHARTVSGIGLAALSCAMLPGCVPQPSATSAAPSTAPISTISDIKVNGVDYGTPASALAASTQNNRRFEAQLPLDPDPVKGRLRIVLPDHDRLRPLVSQQQAAAFKRPVVGDALEFFINVAQQNLHELADAVIKAGAFQSVAVEEQNDVLNPPNGDADFVLWYQVRTALPNNAGPWVGVWLVRHVGSAATLGAAIDPGTPVGAPRLASFVKSVHDDALRLGGRSIAGLGASSLPAAGGLPVTTAGSGFIIDKTGDIVTNAHVISACAAPKITDSANSNYTARIVATDEANDLALVNAEHHWTQAASFRDGSDLRPGDSVIAAGFPLKGLVASSLSVTTGSISAIAGPRDDSRLLQISAPVQPGNSGGPVLDEDGHVIGIVTSQLNGALLALVAGIAPQNVNFAIKSAIVRNFLQAENIEVAHAPSTQGLSAGDVGAIARRFTVHIECGT